MLNFIRRAFGIIFATVGFIVVIVAIVAYFKFMHGGQTDPDSDPISNNSVLKLEVGGLEMIDFNLPTSLLSQLQKYRKQSLIELIDLIDEARQDPRIKAINLDIIGHSFSPSQAEELRAALERFKKDGKKVYAFAYAFGDGSNGTSAFYLASVADKIYMQPHSAVSILGASLESYFLKDLLDDYDISVQAARRNKQKGFIDPYTRADFTPEVKENLTAVINSIISHVQGASAQGRNIEKATFIALMNAAPFHDQQAVKHKLLDDLIHRDQVRDKIKADLTGDLAFVTEKGYTPENKKDQSKNKIGVIFLDSDVIPAGTTSLNPTTPYSPEALDKAFETATKDKDVKVIIFRVNTPGGAVSGAQAIYRSVKRTVDKGIPVIVSMGSVAASAGYYMSAPATKIFANAMTLTGSIGVGMLKPNISKATERYGVTWDRIQVGDNAGMWSITQDFNEASWKFIQESMDLFYANFTQIVADGRKLPLDTVKQIAGGQVWSGAQGKENGLVDEIGGFFEALEDAKKLAQIDDKQTPNLVIFNRVNTSLPLLFSLLGDDVKSVVNAALGIKADVNHLNSTNRIRLTM